MSRFRSGAFGLALVGLVVGLIVALAVIGVGALFDLDVAPAVTGAVAGAVAGTVAPLLSRRS